MRTHTVRSHVRQSRRSRVVYHNPLREHLVHVRSYKRGNEKPEAKLLVQPKIVSPPIDPKRAEAEKLVDAKLAEVVQTVNANKGPYWNKIANFQINYNGRAWKIVDSYDTGGYGDYESCQLCGHRDCRYMYVISDGTNNLTIGDECVGNYIKDLDAKDIFKKHNKRLRESIGKTKSYRDLLIDLLLWESRNGTNSFLTAMKSKVMSGQSLSPNMVSAIKRTIAQDRPKPVASPVRVGWDAKSDRELYNIARDKPKSLWERDTFMPSINVQINNGWKLSDKQRNILIRIIENK